MIPALLAPHLLSSRMGAETRLSHHGGAIFAIFNWANLPIGRFNAKRLVAARIHVQALWPYLASPHSQSPNTYRGRLPESATRSFTLELGSFIAN